MGVELPAKGRLATAPPPFRNCIPLAVGALIRGTLGGIRSQVIHEHILRLALYHRRCEPQNIEVDGEGGAGGRGRCWCWWERRLWLPHGKQQQIRSLLPTIVPTALALALALAFALVGAVP